MAVISFTWSVSKLALELSYLLHEGVFLLNHWALVIVSLSLLPLSPTASADRSSSELPPTFVPHYGGQVARGRLNRPSLIMRFA